MKQKIVFFIDTITPLSSMQLQFFNLCSLLTKNPEFSTTFINNWHPTDFEKYSESFSFYKDINAVNFSQYEGAVFITPINYLMHLLVKIKDLKNASICLYVYHPDAFNWLIFNAKADISKKSDLENFIFKSNSCAFLNFNCINSTFYEKIKIKPLFLPISPDYSILKDFLPQELIDKNVINIGYVGDISIADINSINNIIRNLSIQKLSVPVNIHIIGSIDTLHNFSYRECSSNITKIIYTGPLFGAQKKDYIQKNIDIVFGVELNSIEPAQWGVPIALPVVDKKPYVGNRYVFLFDVTKHIYSWDNNSLLALDNSCYTLTQIINMLYEENRKIELAEKCYEYFKSNNSSYAIEKSLISLITETTLTMNECFKNPTISSRINDFQDYSKGNNSSFNDFLEYEKNNNIAKNQKIPSNSPTVQKAISNHSTQTKQKKHFIKISNGFRKKKRLIHKIFLKTKKIKVAFLVIFDSVFPARPVFEKMLKDTTFDPYIFVIPNIQNSLKYQLNTMQSSYESLFSQYKERVIKAYNYESDSYLDLKDDYQIIFFANPYKSLVHPLHEIEYFLDKPVLPCYVSYGFAALKFWEEVIKTDFYNFNWKVTIENNLNLEHLKKIQIIEGKNALVTGYIKMDKYSELQPSVHSRKRIIISPHHTVSGWNKLNISNFLSYSNFFLELPVLFPEIDFVFRPHPLLFSNLLSNKIWDKKTIDDYLEKISKLPNMSYDTYGDYLQKFSDSDALIHDCGSFIGEYLYTKKPCCYMIKSKEETYSGLIPLGQECMDRHYHAYGKEDIINFIQNVVINGIDPLKEDRERFAEETLYFNYPHSSDFLINYIKSEIEIN